MSCIVTNPHRNFQCQAVLEDMLKKVFDRPRRRSPRAKLIPKPSLSTCLRESVYPANRVNDVLKSVFGEDDLIDGPSSFAARHGIMLALSTTTVPGTQGPLITNYNGFGRRDFDCGMVHRRLLVSRRLSLSISPSLPQPTDKCQPRLSPCDESRWSLRSPAMGKVRRNRLPSMPAGIPSSGRNTG
jgi:hypothetical protein